MLPHPPESHTTRDPLPDEPRPREASAAGAAGAVQPLSRRVDQFARQIATMRRHTATLRRPARATRPDAAADGAVDRLPRNVLDDLHGALESLHAAEEELYRQHEELGRMQATLDEERRRARALFDESPVPALVTGADGTIRDANRAALALLGVDAEELARRPLTAFVAPDDRRAFRDRLDAPPGAPGAEVELSATLLPRAGAPIDAVVVGREAVDPANPAERVVHWALRDVTAERASARERVRLQEELEGRVAARTRELATRTAEVETASREKSTFLATLSHEIRTPVTAIVGYADLLETGIGGPLTTAQRSYVDRLRASTGHLLSLVEGVLDLAKVEAGRVTLDLRPWPAHDVVEDALSMVRPQAEARGLQLTHGCASVEAPVATGDRHRVRQVLVNLLANAIRFTPDGGTVSVRCGRADAPPADAATIGDGPWCWIAVADTGVGIPPGSLAAVFEAFVQTEPPGGGGGSGLGLTISRRLARLMRGDVVAKSEPGRGSTFTLWLPATAG